MNVLEETLISKCVHGVSYITIGKSVILSRTAIPHREEYELRIHFILSLLSPVTRHQFKAKVVIVVLPGCKRPFGIAASPRMQLARRSKF